MSELANSIDIEIDGHFPAEVTFVGDGILNNPTLTLTDKNTDKVYGKLDLSAVTISAGEKLLFSSRQGQEGVWRLVNGEKNRLDRILEFGKR